MRADISKPTPHARSLILRSQCAEFFGGQLTGRIANAKASFVCLDRSVIHFYRLSGRCYAGCPPEWCVEFRSSDPCHARLRPRLASGPIRPLPPQLSSGFNEFGPACPDQAFLRCGNCFRSSGVETQRPLDPDSQTLIGFSCASAKGQKLRPV
jgi:hypothetical protein